MRCSLLGSRNHHGTAGGAVQAVHQSVGLKAVVCGSCSEGGVDRHGHARPPLRCKAGGLVEDQQAVILVQHVVIHEHVVALQRGGRDGRCWGRVGDGGRDEEQGAMREDGAEAYWGNLRLLLIVAARGLRAD